MEFCTAILTYYILTMTCPEFEMDFFFFYFKSLEFGVALVLFYKANSYNPIVNNRD